MNEATRKMAQDLRTRAMVFKIMREAVQVAAKEVRPVRIIIRGNRPAGRIARLIFRATRAN
jgi:hypothetical protein